MSNTVIKVENLSKQYRLGVIGTGTLSHDLNRFWAKIRGKEDPYLKIGESNDRTKKGDSDYVWALKDINFEVKQGEVLGIIGRNGAGKSTLLKILSQVTHPTTGSVRMKGRVASLLEVGTGFHPDLTGRENIYINGAILGMRKWEIDKKLDEIIQFAGVERYIDTPVKRYSSGMLVRLGFSVAAHLEPEILIVDEVLAVGDAEFQKKCMGKMGEVSRSEGRTILFVSHNIQAMQNLCSSFLYMKDGGVVDASQGDKALKTYLSDLMKKGEPKGRMLPEINDAIFSLKSLKVQQNNTHVESVIESGEELHIEVNYIISERISGLRIYCDLIDEFGGLIFRSFNDGNNLSVPVLESGEYVSYLKIPKNFLGPILYRLRISAGIHNVRNIFSYEIPISVIHTGSYNRAYSDDTFRGMLGIEFNWMNKRVEV